MSNTRPLGETQARVLEVLHERRYWFPGCGWYWQNYSFTKRVLESLVRRGLATIDKHGRYRPTKQEG